MSVPRRSVWPGRLLRLSLAFALAPWAVAAAAATPAQFPTDPAEAMRVYETEVDVEDWADGPVSYIMLEDEKDVWEDLEENVDRREFIRWFWLRRDPDTRDQRNPFQEGFYTRVATANDRFPGIPRGWKTDRGRVWIVFGRPDNIARRGNGDVWTYNTGSGGDISFASYQGEFQVGFEQVEVTQYIIAGGVGPGAWPAYVLQAIDVVNRNAIQNPDLEFEPIG